MTDKPNTPLITSASVKVMRSYDYCHFEIVLGTDAQSVLSIEQVDELRKEAARLADKAVKQYQQAKSHANGQANSKYEKKVLQSEVERILAKPEWDRSPNELAKVKALADEEYWRRRGADYDYSDDEEEL